MEFLLIDVGATLVLLAGYLSVAFWSDLARSGLVQPQAVPPAAAGDATPDAPARHAALTCFR